MIQEKIQALSQELERSQDELKRTWLRDQIEHHAVYRVKPGNRSIPGKAPNTNYTWQIYLRRCMFDPKFVFTAAELLVKRLSSTDVQIGACEDAGVPLGLAMATVLGTPMISLKKSRKVYGLLNFTEGAFTGKPILLVDDVAGSQATLRSAVQTLTSFKLPIATEYATLVNKTLATHRENYLHSRRLISLVDCDEMAMSWNDYVKKYNREPDFGAYY